MLRASRAYRTQQDQEDIVQNNRVLEKLNDPRETEGFARPCLTARGFLHVKYDSEITHSCTGDDAFWMAVVG